MDAPRTTLVLTIAALLAGSALAEPPSQSAPVRYSGNDWSSAGPTSAPTISATSRDRYGNPLPTYPQNAQPQSITNRVQNGFNETSNSLRNGVDAGVRSATNGINSAAQQTLGTAGYPSQPAAPPANTNSRSLAPPPWPTGAAAPAAPPTSSWDTTPLPAAPVDHSVLASPPNSSSSSNWTSIGTTIAAPPLLTPQMPVSTSAFPPLNSTAFDNGPALTTDSYRGNPPNTSTGSTSSWGAQPSTSSTVRSTSSNDDFTAAWDASSNNNFNNSNNSNGASISRNSSNSSRPISSRDAELPGSQRIAVNSPEGRSTAAKPADSWADSWAGNPQSGNATIGGNKSATIGSAPSNGPSMQPPANGPAFGQNPNTTSTAGNNPSFGVTNSMGQQPPMTVNAGKPVQTTNGESQPWALPLALLVLAGSLAGNIYLGGSYMDARQKYQALVRRTADTFRRTHTVAA